MEITRSNSIISGSRRRRGLGGIEGGYKPPPLPNSIKNICSMTILPGWVVAGFLLVHRPRQLPNVQRDQLGARLDKIFMWFLDSCKVLIRISILYLSSVTSLLKKIKLDPLTWSLHRLSLPYRFPEHSRASKPVYFH